MGIPTQTSAALCGVGIASALSVYLWFLEGVLQPYMGLRLLLVITLIVAPFILLVSGLRGVAPLSFTGPSHEDWTRGGLRFFCFCVSGLGTYVVLQLVFNIVGRGI